MNEEQYLLLYLMEEIAELQEMLCRLQQHASKCIRFGLTDQHEGRPLNVEALRSEYTDVIAVFELLKAKGIFTEPSIVDIDQKLLKANFYMGYSACKQKWGDLNVKETS